MDCIFILSFRRRNQRGQPSRDPTLGKKLRRPTQILSACCHYINTNCAVNVNVYETGKEVESGQIKHRIRNWFRAYLRIQDLDNAAPFDKDAAVFDTGIRRDN